MIAIVQRVKSARVIIDQTVAGEIAAGLVALAAIHTDDTPADIAWMAAKLPTLRIFQNPQDPDKYFDLDVKSIAGGILLISNFTVAADTTSGRRPSLSPAASPAAAAPLFDALLAAVKTHAGPTVHVATGQFGADMLVELANDGPVTFILDSREASGRTSDTSRKEKK